MSLYPTLLKQNFWTGVAIKSEQDSLEAINLLHEKGIPTVIITSAEAASHSVSILIED